MKPHVKDLRAVAAALAAVVCLTASANWGQPKKPKAAQLQPREPARLQNQETKPSKSRWPDHLQRWMDRCALEAQRINGVRLRATASVDRVEEDAEIRIDWELDYLGPRPPVIIPPPSLERDEFQTTLSFYAISADDKSHRLAFMAPVNPAPGRPLHRNDFLKLKLGEVASGTIKVTASLFWERLRKEKTTQFDTAGPKALFLRLEHAPGLRYGDMDAWTGTVRSQLVEVPLDVLNSVRRAQGGKTPQK